MARLLRWLTQAVVLAALAAFIGALSVAPGYTYHPADMAFIRISFTHGAPRADCRRPTQAELTKLPPNQRRPNDCPRERPVIVLKFELNGVALLDETLPPSGLSGDSPSHLYRGFRVSPGAHRLRLAMRDNPRTVGFDYTSDFDVTLSPRQNLVVDFNPRSGGFRVR